MNKKILFTDLDETLLTTDKKVSKKDLESIDKMLKAGHRFVFVTGRPLHYAMKTANEFGFVKEGFYVAAYNGGLIYDPVNNKTIVEFPMPYEYCDYIFKEGRKHNIPILTFFENNVVTEFENEETSFYSKRVGMPLLISNNYRDVVTKEPPKMVAISLKGREVLESFRDDTRSFCEGKLSTVFSTPFLLEYALPQADKGFAIKYFCDFFNIPIEHSIACGDEENDITMIDAAGIGVGMKNGIDLVKAHADYVTNHTNNENPMTEVIEKFILP